MSAATIRIRIGQIMLCVAAVAVIGCGACGPSVDEVEPLELPSEEGKRYASAVCKAAETCGCANPFDSRSACEIEYLARFDSLLEAGFEVVPECFEAWLEDTEEIDPCHEQSAPSGGAFPCSQLRGRKTKGSSCDAQTPIALLIDECREGLSCRDAQCVDTPPTNQTPWKDLELGEPCGVAYEGFCRREELFCNLGKGVCEQKVSSGACFERGCDVCPELDGSTALYCEGATLTDPGTCAPLPRFEEPCDPLKLFECGVCELEGQGWCDPASNTCVEGGGPRLCRKLHP